MNNITWETLTAIATCIVVWIAWKQLSDINKTAKADFYNRFSEGFFNENCRNLVMLFFDNLLKFTIMKSNGNEDNGEFAYFEINVDSTNKVILDKKDACTIKKIYTVYEIDDVLLGYFEDISCYEKRGLIDIQHVYDGFDWYIETIWKNNEIQKYIAWQRKEGEDDEDIYEETEYIYNKLQFYRNKKIFITVDINLSNVSNKSSDINLLRKWQRLNRIELMTDIVEEEDGVIFNEIKAFMTKAGINTTMRLVNHLKDNKRDYFVTSDEDIIGKRQELGKSFGIKIKKPEEMVNILKKVYDNYHKIKKIIAREGLIILGFAGLFIIGFCLSYFQIGLIFSDFAIVGYLSYLLARFILWTIRMLSRFIIWAVKTLRK